MRAVLFLMIAVGAGLSQAASSAELREILPDVCVSEVDPELSLGSGIATGELKSKVEVRRCDGEWSALGVGNGKFVLRKSVALHVATGSRITAFPKGPLPTNSRFGNTTDWVIAEPCVAEGLYDGEPSLVTETLSAWLTGPTEDYRHGILGDSIEASGFCVRDLRTKEKPRLKLPPGSVFEDLRVRLVDLTGDGQAEFVVIRSYLDRGAALAVYHLVDGRVAHLAETPPIGTPNRWLNPAGAADFDGDGRVEIAYVETPHIGGTLRVWELVDGKLHQEQAVAGFSNHAIGSRELDLSAVLDWNADGVPDLAVPANGRRSLRIVTFAGGTFAELDAIPHDAEIVTAILATDLDADGKPELLYGLADGRLLLARP